MTTDLEEAKKKIEERKRRIQLQEKIIKEKEQQRKFRRFSEIVEIAFKANIAFMEDPVLLGAFLEIAEKMKDEKIVREWKKIGEKHLQTQPEDSKIRISISFQNDPGKEIKDKLKELKFRWYSFRKEYCGFGNEKEIESLLKGTDYSLEVI